MPTTTNPRRQFLKNTGIAALATSFLGWPTRIKARTRVAPLATVNCTPTTLDLYGQGPFYTPNAPILDYSMVEEEDEGTRLILSGQVASKLDCIAAIPNTEIDVWHANAAGQYDNDGFNFRAKFFTNEQGYYLLETILPGKYLNGSSYRPSHIHFRITAPGYPPFITQLYFEGDTDIPGDAAASVSSGQYDASKRIIALTENSDGKMEGTWNIYIEGDGINAAHDLHLDKGVLYSLGPNPFRDSLTINYGVFQRAVVSLSVHDLQGREVAKLENQELLPEKYSATWQPPSTLALGYYFIALKVNDVQVHYMKVLKQ